MTYRLSDEALNWSLAHIQRFGDTDIFPKPFEIEAITHGWDDLMVYLGSQDLDMWKTRSKRTCLTPKGKYAYRVSTQLDPLDTLIYLGLVYEGGAALESYRIPANDEIVFSHRFAPAPDGQLYDGAYGWTAFLQRCRESIETNLVTHVVLADVSDFYHRLPHHPLDNTLATATGSGQCDRIMMKLFGQWTGGKSYGIPVGPSASRIIADVAINDVDQYLRAESATFCRYSDDYRIFCTSYKDAYEKLAMLADLLYRNHGLTLQQGKTSVVTVDTFRERYLASPETEELNRLKVTFHGLVEDLEMDNPYEAIFFESLDGRQKALIGQLNLEGLLAEQLKAVELDIGIMRFILRRLAQLNHYAVASQLLASAEHCYPVMSSIMEYLHALPNVPDDVRLEVGGRLMGLIESSIIGHLPYHRSWLLSVFASSGKWGQEDKFVTIYNGYPEPFTRRKAVLALGRTGQFFWFRAGRDTVMDLQPWERRAFLAAASCLPSDERKYWYNSLKGNLDQLERAVVNWAADNPLNGD